MLKILYKYYPLAYVILYRGNHKEARGVSRLPMDQSWPRKACVSWSLYSSLYTAGVPAHAPGEEPRLDLEILFLSLLQANMYMKNFQLLSYHTAIRQDSENLDASSTLATGVGWHRQLPYLPIRQQLSPSSSPPRHLYPAAMPSAFTLMDNFILHIWVLHRDCLWAAYVAMHIESLQVPQQPFLKEIKNWFRTDESPRIN